MSQTNIQVPIEQRPSAHDKDVVARKDVRAGDARFWIPEEHGRPSSNAQDDRPVPLCVCHGEKVPSPEAPDLLYGEHTPVQRKMHMAGRRHEGAFYNVGRNVGSDHLMMEALPHGSVGPMPAPAPTEGGITLPKDQ
jgi:hypothetical protein